MNGGKGILELVLGIDYSSLVINPKYVLPPTKVGYTSQKGVCSSVASAGAPNNQAFKVKDDAECQQFCDF
jgi:hypothetical protein